MELKGSSSLSIPHLISAGSKSLHKNPSQPVKSLGMPILTGKRLLEGRRGTLASVKLISHYKPPLSGHVQFLAYLAVHMLRGSLNECGGTNSVLLSRCEGAACRVEQVRDALQSCTVVGSRAGGAG